MLDVVWVVHGLLSTALARPCGNLIRLVFKYYSRGKFGSSFQLWNERIFDVNGTRNDFWLCCLALQFTWPSDEAVCTRETLTRHVSIERDLLLTQAKWFSGYNFAQINNCFFCGLGKVGYWGLTDGWVRGPFEIFDRSWSVQDGNLLTLFARVKGRISVGSFSGVLIARTGARNIGIGNLWLLFLSLGVCWTLFAAEHSCQVFTELDLCANAITSDDRVLAEIWVTSC